MFHSDKGRAGKIANANILLAFAIVTGFALRVYQLGAHNLWYDELISYWFTRDLNRIKAIFLDAHPPLYYLILYFWRVLFGDSEFSLRFLSMFFGVLAIPLIYKLGKLLFNKRTGLISALILSVSPIHIWYSQEARAYSILVFLSMLIVYSLYLALEANKPRYWFSLLTVLILGVYMNYLIFFMPAIASVLFFKKKYRDKFKKWMVVCFTVLIAFSLYLPTLLKQSSYIAGDFWLLRPDLKSIIITLENFSAGFSASPNIFLAAFILFSILFSFGILFWFKEKKEVLALLFCFIFIPVGAVFLISQIRPIYITRQFLSFLPFYYIIVAAGLARIKMRAFQFVFYAGIILLFIPGLLNYYSFRMPSPRSYHFGVFVKKSISPAADYIRPKLAKGDLVCSSSVYSKQIIYYLISQIRDKQIKYPYLILGSNADNLSLLSRRCRQYNAPLYYKNMAAVLDEKTIIPGVRHLEEYNFKRVWLVSPLTSDLNTFFLEPLVGGIRIWMAQHFQLLERQEFDGFVVELFAKKL